MFGSISLREFSNPSAGSVKRLSLMKIAPEMVVSFRIRQAAFASSAKMRPVPTFGGIRSIRAIDVGLDVSPP